MIANLIRIQKEARRLLSIDNPCWTDYEVLDGLLEFINKMSPYEVVNKPSTTEWIIRNKKTLKEIDL